MENKPLFREVAEDLTFDLPKYPDLASYIKGLNELITIDLTKYSYEEIGRIFYERAILFQQTFGINAVEKFNTRKFYRVRMNIGEEEDVNLIRTHSYPLAKFCKLNGRANLKGKSVFYCSNIAMTSIIESKPSEGQIGYLSEWQANSNRDVKYGICLPRNLRSENEFDFMAHDIHEFIDKNSVIEAGEKAEHFRFFHRFVAERFVDETEPYSLTSWIANEMLYGEQWRDFILYPSVAHQHQACNMAFHPNSADTLLRFNKVVKFRVVKYDGKILEFSDVSVGQLENAIIRWRKPYENELSQIMPDVSKKDK